MTSSTTPLDIALALRLDQLAAEHGLVLESVPFDQKFAELIRKLGTGPGVAILIDEYDKPLVEYIDQPEKAASNRQILCDFYGVIKSLDRHIRFFFLTGIAKFSKDSIFSDLNQLQDITFHPGYSQLLGYTQEELDHYFQPFFPKVQSRYEGVYPDIRTAIRNWYDGYTWDGQHHLYNPFSILLLFNSGLIRDYWFSSGTPQFLIQLFRSRQHSFTDFLALRVKDSDFHAFQLEKLQLGILLFQTGYLTVKEIDPLSQDYTLGFPNLEVESSFSHHLLADLTQPYSEFNTGLLADMVSAWEGGQVDEAMGLLKVLFSRIAYPVQPDARQSIFNQERYYHSLFYVVLSLLGLHIQTEVITFKGRIDPVLEVGGRVYIIEFKVGSAENALAQIKEREYALPYADRAGEVFLLGIGFDVEERNIGGYVLEPFQGD